MLCVVATGSFVTFATHTSTYSPENFIVIYLVFCNVTIDFQSKLMLRSHSIANCRPAINRGYHI